MTSDVTSIPLYQHYSYAGHRMWIEALGEKREIASIDSEYKVRTTDERTWHCHGDTLIVVERCLR